MGNTEQKRAGREEDLGIHGGGFSKVAEREGYTRFNNLYLKEGEFGRMIRFI